jgi:Na+-transporting methylmalonyl-CoA/oxaloacetate decarboxylase gamma subunit
MLPSEKWELWVRRIGYTVLILMALYIIVWVVRFIGKNYGRAMEQREIPPEARAPIVTVDPQMTQIA